MIKGVKRKGHEYDGKFDPEMGIFLGSFSSIIQTLSGSSTKFKNSGITTEIKTSLSKEFENAKTELIGSLLNTYLKLDKLNLLSEIAIEIKSLKRLSVNYHIDKSYSPEDCNFIYEMLEKMNDFIKGQTQILESTNQSDYPTPYYMIPDKESSNFEKPLNYFEFLFNRNGIENLRNYYIKYYSSDEYPDSTYNLETETFTHNHYDIVTGEWSETSSDFNIIFQQKLRAEFKNSKELIDDYIDKQIDEASIVLFIKKILNKLNLLLLKIADNSETFKYNDCEKPIDALIQHIYKKHKIFISSGKIAVQNSSKSHNVFKLIGTKTLIKAKATDLHDSLTKNELVLSECKKDFVKLFTGQPPEEKIVWQGLKGELKSFINLLIEENKIENCKTSKWIITAANFKFKNQEFTSNTIKDTKKATNEIKLKYLVTSI